MLKAGDFKVCLSSIEFSVFYQQPTPKCCPSCGYFFSPETLSEVRLSSLILVLGVGSWLCYKLIIKRKQKMKPKKPMPCSNRTINDQIIFNRMDKLFNYRLSTSSSATAMAAAATAAAVYSNHHSNLKVNTADFHGLPVSGETSYTVSYSDSDDDMEGDYYIDENDTSYIKAMDQYSYLKRSHSISSQSGEIGEGTIAKLDQLLHQIEDIKESVGEINSDLFNVHSYDHNRLLVSNSDEEDGHFLTLIGHSLENNHPPLDVLGDKEDPQTPGLEWDSNDINLFSDLNIYQGSNTQSSVLSSSPYNTSNALITTSSAIKQNAAPQPSLPSSMITNSKNSNSFKPFGPDHRDPVILDCNSLSASSSFRNFNMDTSLTNHTVGTMSSSGITSIDGSLLSSPDQERIRLESIHDLLKEARRLGLLNDLIKFLLKNANRDSAYFEE